MGESAFQAMPSPWKMSSQDEGQSLDIFQIWSKVKSVSLEQVTA